MKIDKGSFMTVGQTQAILGVSRGTVLGWIRSGRLAAFKLGGGRLWRIQGSDLEALVERSRCLKSAGRRSSGKREAAS